MKSLIAPTLLAAKGLLLPLSAAGPPAANGFVYCGATAEEAVAALGYCFWGAVDAEVGYGMGGAAWLVVLLMDYLIGMFVGGDWNGMALVVIVLIYCYGFAY